MREHRWFGEILSSNEDGSWPTLSKMNTEFMPHPYRRNFVLCGDRVGTQLRDKLKIFPLPIDLGPHLFYQ
jgi:hypothetical protein